MSDWTAGYVADVGYTYGYYTELNPERIRLALLSEGYAFPEVKTACELGFGQGLSVNIHAAASQVEWHGTDFNPAQAAFARELAAQSGAAAKLRDDSFAEFLERKDLPDFDFIGLHGIWSWISDENRSLIVEFIRRKLKVGGVAYVSYNTLPGWAAFMPMRHLITRHAEVMGVEGQGIVTRIDDAIKFADALMECNTGYGRANPQVGERLKKLKEQNRNYLAHEYFNRDWHPMHFTTVAELLAPAKLQYCSSANYLEHVADLNLTQAQQDFLREIPDRMFREAVKDFMVNHHFRRDYWVKGARKLSAFEVAEKFGKERVMLTTSRGGVSLKVAGMLGEASMNEGIYNPLLDLLADYKIRQVAEIEAELASKGIAPAQVRQAVVVLCGNGTLTPVQDDACIAQSAKSARCLNGALIEKASSGNDIGFLASPVTGGGVAVGRFQQLFLAQWQKGESRPEAWVDGVWKLLAAQGQKIFKDGKTLETEAENKAELLEQARTFADKQIAGLKALQIA